MPFIEEDKLNLIHEDLENYSLKIEQTEKELRETEEILKFSQKKARITSIILGVLLGLSLGACYYFYTNSVGISFTEDDISAIKIKENNRVLDSVKRANKRALRALDKTKSVNEKSGFGSGNLDEAVNEIKNNITNETIYSVQIGALYKNKKFPLLSSKMIPSIITSKDGYFKYSIGLFTTLKEAKKMRKELISLGIKDAFVASYIDGKRQKIHD